MVTPSTVNFNYKKFGTIPPAVVLYHDKFFDNIPNIPDVYASHIELYDATLNSVKIRLKNPGADNLPVGLNSETINIQLFDVDLLRNFTVGTITLNTTVEDTLVLELSPNNLSFSFTIGGATPNNKVISITSENPWTITKTAAWLSLSTASGANSGSFEIGVITTGLPVGSYTDTVTVDDGIFSKTIGVTFIVSDGNTATDFAYVSPELLKFGFTVGGAIPPAKNIEMNVSESWTATANVPWLNLPVTSGALGAQVIQTALLDDVDLAALSPGFHYGNITITVGAIIRNIDIELEIYDFTSRTPSSDDLLFTDSDNILGLQSNRLDTFMYLKFSTSYKSNLFNYFVRLPFFKGGATRNIGVIPKKIIGNQSLVGLSELNVFEPYFPLNLNIDITEKELFTESIVATSAVSNLTFIKGTKPSSNLLSEIAPIMYLTKNATLVFSVLSNNVTTGSIFITGSLVETIDVSASLSAEKEFYTVSIPLAPLGNFKEGDELTFSFLNENITVVIVDEGIDNSTVFWENEWGCWDSLELRGEVYIEPGIKRNTASFRISENRIKNKILQVLQPTTYSIHTGIVHTKQELEMMHKMLCSRNIYLQTQGFVVPVIPSTKKVPTFKTLQTLKGFDINFNHAEE